METVKDNPTKDIMSDQVRMEEVIGQINQNLGILQNKFNIKIEHSDGLGEHLIALYLENDKVKFKTDCEFWE